MKGEPLKVLITGGAGFIGSHIADACLAQGWQVVIVDDLSNGRMENVRKQTGCYVFSILDDDFPELVQAEMPRIIFHEAAQPSLRRSIEEPDYDAKINIIGTIKVIQAAKSVDAHVMFASTSAVYAPDATPPFYEPDHGRPNLPYGIAKFASELYLKNSGISYTILRYGNVYGPRQVPVGENQLIPHCIRFLRGEEPDFAINGDGLQMRDYTYVKDIACANVMVRAKGVFNCGTGQGTTVNEVCRMLAEIAGKPETHFQHRAPKTGEARHSVLATEMIKRTGWRPATKLVDGLRETWEAWE